MSLTIRKIKKFGWLRDLPDGRDEFYKVKAPVPLPEVVDLRSLCPPVYDQGSLGSCTANAIGAAFEFDLMKQQKKVFMPSRLFIYYNERVMENTVAYDNGASIRDGIKSVNKIGVCDEKKWKYNISKFAKRPPDSCFVQALKNRSLCYNKIDNTSLFMLQQCLAVGFPFVFGFSVYESFMSDSVANTGVAHMPDKKESVIGGHAVLGVGYNNEEKRFIIRNSWNESWGMEGYFTMPYEYLTDRNLSADFWMLTMV